jgi:hypothetical protein
MPQKKKQPSKAQRREARLRKAREWAPAYKGTHIVRVYRKKYGVDPGCAIRELEEIGAITPEKAANLRAGEVARLEQLRLERERKREQAFHDRGPHSNDTFFFIAGYTSGGAPYGVTWAEMGMEPYETLK